MSEFYKMEPLRWDRGTDNLTLEQEAAYLRICNAIYAADQPIAENYRALAGMWRCNERKAKRLLAELVGAGKVYVEAGWIKNEKALNDVSIRRELRVKRQLAGHSGGIQSGKSRAKPLENKGSHEASGSTRKEVEVEEIETTNVVSKRKRGSRISPDWRLPRDWGLWAMDQGLPELSVRREADKFRDYWLARTKDATKRDWQATWRNWVRLALERQPQNRRGGHDEKLEAWGIRDAKPFDPSGGDWNPAATSGPGAADLPEVQRHAEGTESEDPMPFGDGETGWAGGSLLALRLVGGCPV